MRAAIIIVMVLLAGCDTRCVEGKGSNRYQIIDAGEMNLLLDTHEGRVWKQVKLSTRYIWQQQTIIGYSNAGSGDAPIDGPTWASQHSINNTPENKQ